MIKCKRIVSAILVLTLMFMFSSCKVKNVEKEAETDFQKVPTEVYGEEGIKEQGENSTDVLSIGTENSNSGKQPTNNKEPSSNISNAEDEPEALEEIPGREIVKVTIPEGYTLTQIFKKLDSNGVCSFNELMKTAQTYDYSYYPLIAERPQRTYAFKLEGYLFPSTYEFYKNEKPQDAIGRFLRKGKTIFGANDRANAQALGCSLHDILTVASIVEKEGANPKEVRKIAGVIYNRLNKGMKLQMDSGITYIEKRVKPYISGDINRYNGLYNMYKCSGLPAGPICNPGLVTINAALKPDTSGGYLYFCHDKNANYYYAATYEEHLANLEKAGLK